MREDQHLRKYSEQLFRSASTLKSLSYSLLIVLFLDMILIILYSVDTYDNFIYFIASLCCSVSGIMLLSFFNIKRKAAFVLYDELLDEMEWGEDRNKFKKRPSLETRIALKKFLNSTDLPFTSGIAGQTFYFALFLLLISVLIILFRVSSW